MTSQTSSETRAGFSGWWVLGILPGLLAGAVFLALLLLTLGQSMSGASVVDWLATGIRKLIDFAGGEAGLMGLPLTADSPGYWYASRAAGMVGYLLLWAVTAWGLVLSSKMNRGWMKSSTAVRIHTALSTAALIVTGLHALVLMGDRYIGFSLAGLLYPFTAEYRPFWVGLGQIGIYMAVGLGLSLPMRKAAGYKTWRALHYLSFVVYALVLIHALAVGTDTAQVPVRLMYLITGSIIVFLVNYRLLTSGSGSDAPVTATGRAGC